ncbi:MAG: hypothetical protein AAF226_19755, partial [Verrucomicrobiota bacterium]
MSTPPSPETQARKAVVIEQLKALQEPTLQNDLISLGTTEVVAPQLQIVKTANTTTAAPGDTVTYTLTLSHAANSTATAFNINLFDDTASLTTLEGVVGNLMGSSTDTNATLTGGIVSNQLQMDVTQLAVGETVTITYDVVLADNTDLIDRNGVNQPDDVDNTANISWYSVSDGTNPESRRETTSDDHEVAIVRPDIDVNLIKAVLSVNPAALASPTYTADTDNSTGSVNNVWADTLANLGTTPLTSFVLHNDTDTSDGITDLTDWNVAFDRDLLTENGGVDAGDVVTYGIFVENAGSREAHELQLNDVPGAGSIDTSSVVVTLGDGTTVASSNYVVTATAGG